MAATQVTNNGALTTKGIAGVRTQDGNGIVDGAWKRDTIEAHTTLTTSFSAQKTKGLEWRLGQINAISTMVKENADAIVKALHQDLGRPEFEALTTEVGGLIQECAFVRDQLQYWMQPENITTDMLNQPASSVILHEPKGTVLIISPWNFPISLALKPAIAAVAAGNCVVIKPSEMATHCERLLTVMCEKFLDQSCFRVITGAVAETTELLSMKWDHIFYTGNGFVGRAIMRAAAENLTPVTLELGGKCPVVVDQGLTEAKMLIALRRFLQMGLFMNAGQICVSPDYFLVHKDAMDLFLKVSKQVMTEFQSSDNTTSKTLGKIISQRHFDRVANLINTAGGNIFWGGLEKADRSKSFLPPTIIVNPDSNSPILQEEIFGPVVLVMSVNNIDAAIAEINSRDHALSLYMIAEDQTTIDRVLAGTNSGGVCVNDAVVHLGNPYLPFGGVGGSGQGNYGGKFGFETFSTLRPVMTKGLSFDFDRYPPYTAEKTELIRKLQMGGLIPSWVPKLLGLAVTTGLAMKIKSRL
eukprot:m.29896 g.29896  ORF g.29896 m.29896 type:complete len:526 (-) comp16175_c0_seq1:140-1717(-)